MSIVLVDKKSLKHVRISIGHITIEEYDAITAQEGSPMTIGVAPIPAETSVEAVFAWDEVGYIEEGSLTITSEGKSFTANKGDFFFVSRGTKVQFSTETGAKELYVTFPTFYEALEEVKKSGVPVEVEHLGLKSLPE